MKRILLNFCTLCLDRPYLSLSLLAISIVFAGVVTALKVTPNNAPSVYLPEQTPAIEYQRKLDKFFPSDQIIIGIFESPDVLAPDFIRKIGAASEALLSLPKIARVYSLTHQDHIETSSDGFGVTPLIEVNQVDSQPRSYWLNRIQSDKFARDQFVSEDLKRTVIVAVPKDVENSFDRIRFQNEFQSAISNSGLADHTIGEAGSLPLDTAQFLTVARDNMVFVPLVLLVGLFILWWLYRRLSILIFATLGIFATLTITVALHAVIDAPVTSVSSILGPLMTALTVSTLIHLFNAVLSESQVGAQGRTLIVNALNETAIPSLFMSLTTAGGLAALMLSPVPTVKVFGGIAACGVLISYFIVMVLLPPLLLKWSSDKWIKPAGSLQKFDSLLGYVSRISIRHPLQTLIFAGATIALYSMEIQKLTISTNLLKFFDRSHPINLSTERLGESFPGTATFSIVFEGQEVDQFKNPEFIKRLKVVQDWLEQQPGVDKSVSMVEIVESMHKAFNGGKAEFDHIPNSKELISQYLFIYDGQNLYDLINRDFNFTRINVNTTLYGTKEAKILFEHLEAFLKQQHWGTADWQITGFTKLISDQEDLLVLGQIRTLWMVILIAFAFLFIFARSIWGAIACLIPNVVPALFLFSLMGTLDIWLNVGTVLVASIVIGIAIDDTIHLYHSFRQHLMRSRDRTWAMARTLRRTGRAVVSTSVILSCQFAVLIFSDFNPAKDFGILAFSGVIFALIIDLTFTPALFSLVVKRWER